MRHNAAIQTRTNRKPYWRECNFEHCSLEAHFWGFFEIWNLEIEFETSFVLIFEILNENLNLSFRLTLDSDDGLRGRRNIWSLLAVLAHTIRHTTSLQYRPILFNIRYSKWLISFYYVFRVICRLGYLLFHRYFLFLCRLGWQIGSLKTTRTNLASLATWLWRRRSEAEPELSLLCVYVL